MIGPHERQERDADEINGDGATNGADQLDRVLVSLQDTGDQRHLEVCHRGSARCQDVLVLLAYALDAGEMTVCLSGAGKFPEKPRMG